MLKSGKSFVKIGSRFQKTFSFYFIEISSPPGLLFVPTSLHLNLHPLPNALSFNA